MFNYRFLLISLLCGLNTLAFSQTVVSGFVRDYETGEALIGAYVIDTLSAKVQSTNNYGYFSIILPKKNNILKISYVGYSSPTIVLKGTKDTTLTIHLTSNAGIEEVLIRSEINSQRTNLSWVESMTPLMVNALPAIMGESDIIKTMTLMPGVSFGNEAASGYYVRGSSSDQNLLLIDGAPIYNPYHLHGYFSVFNTDAINKATLFKGAVPASYGGRLASVMDINMREGNTKQLSGQLTLGTVTAKALLEGPIIKDKTSFLLTARRSMLDVMNPGLSSAMSYFSGMSQVAGNMEIMDYYFFDYNAKINHKINAKNRLYLNLYQSKDNYKSSNKDYAINNSQDWGNLSSSLRWNHIYSNSLFSNLTLYYTGYNYQSKDEVFIEESPNLGENSRSYSSRIKDLSAKMDFNYNLHKHSIKFGGQYLNQVVAPSISVLSQVNNDASQTIDTTFNSPLASHKAVLYLEDEFQVSDKLSLIAGLHFSGYVVPEKFYPSLQPRLSVNYMPTNRIALKASYTRMVQPLHLLSNTWSGDPSDIWVPSTKNIKPEYANQLAGGISYSTKHFNILGEIYWKNMHNLIDYKEGASYLSEQSDWQQKVETGTGKAHGFELSVKKNKGTLTGLISYTYAKSTRQFENINQGRAFPFIYDRTHSISTALMYRINEKWNIGGNWIFASGQPVSIADTYLINNLQQEEQYKVFNSLNSSRMPNYHRLDLSTTYTKELPAFTYSISAGIYNAYNRQNAYSIYDGGETLYTNSLLGFLPYLSLSFKF